MAAAAAGTFLGLMLHGGAGPARAAAEPLDLIAFETPAGIHLINSDGSGLRRLPGTRPGDQNPNWSPDGRRLVFWSDADATGEIYVCDADGSKRRRLTRDDQASDYGPTDQYPGWSPNGRLIAFDSYRSGEWHIWVMRPDGNGVRRVTKDGRGGSSAEWSPDSERIAYTADWEGTSLAIVNLDGSGTRPLRSLSPERDWSPSWSPDGTQMAFASEAAHKKGEIYVVGVDGGAPSRLTRNDARDVDPVWSPDGSQLLFGTGRAGHWEVYVMAPDGTGQRRVTRIPTEHACCGAWRPTG
jgi:TolB protein